jgi:hypothetical protein
MNQSTSLEIEELADGVRYVLPRRRRRGWAALVWHAVVAFFFYFTIPIFLVWAVVFQNAPWWFLAVGFGAVLLFFLGGLSNTRNAWAILATPDIAIELRTGRIVLIRQTLAWTTTKEVPVADVRRLSVRGLVPGEDVPPDQRGRWGRRWRQWFSRFPLEEMERAERRQAEVLRYFGTLVLEGEGDAEIALAEEYGRTCLTCLAEDLADRIKREGPHVSVEQRNPWPAPIAADDPRLIRPAQITNIKTDRRVDTFVFEVPPPGVSYGRCLGSPVAAALCFVFAGYLMQTFGWPPGLPDLCTMFFVGSLATTGFGAITIAIRSLGAGVARTIIFAGAGKLTWRIERPIISRQRTWAAGQMIAACLIQQRPTTNSAGKAILTYDFIVLDQAMRGFVLLRDRPEAELEWVAAVLHKELGLGREPSHPSAPQQDTVPVGN